MYEVGRRYDIALDTCFLFYFQTRTHPSHSHESRSCLNQFLACQYRLSALYYATSAAAADDAMACLLF